MSGECAPRPPCTPDEARRSPAARRALDGFYAADLPPDEREGFLEHLKGYDRRQACRERRRDLAEAAALEDTPAAMRVRADAVVADLVDQLMTGDKLARGSEAA